jgi:aspartate racemase
MKTVGIIGGIAPESTVDYYRLIIAKYREQIPDGNYPPLLINSINMTKMLGFIGAKQNIEVIEYLSGEVRKLASAGATFAVLASNTPHIVFDEIQKQSPIPMISIVETACDEAAGLGLKKVGLFGTKFTMQGGFYNSVFARKGMDVVLPDPDDQSFIHQKYMGELVNGIFRPETKERLLAIAGKLAQSHGMEGLILGGTELPLILKEPSHNGIPILDTTRIHVKRIVQELISEARCFRVFLVLVLDSHAPGLKVPATYAGEDACAP